MATTHKVINSIKCNSADWTNCERSTISKADPLDALVQQILHHPMKDCISVAWVFSYQYQKLKRLYDVTESRIQACAVVIIKLDNLY